MVNESNYRRNQWILLGIAALLTAGVLAWVRQSSQAPPPVEESFLSQSAHPAALVQVEVKGEVAKPGVFTVPAGTRAGTLLERAGARPAKQALPEAWSSLGVVNGALLEYWIDASGSPRLAVKKMDTGAMGLLLISMDLNSATAEELESLPDVGPATAKAILEYRTAHGPFKSYEELLEVKGVGPKLLESLRYRVVLGKPL